MVNFACLNVVPSFKKSGVSFVRAILSVSLPNLVPKVVKSFL